MSLWAKPPEETLMHVYPLESRLLRRTRIFKLPPPPPLSKHSNKKSVTENAMLLAATNIQ